MIGYSRATTDEELNQILQLQQKNLLRNIAAKIQQNEGFVTVQHTYDILHRMNNVCPHIIAKNMNEVVGYAICMHPQFSNDIPLLKPMFNEINAIVPDNATYITMGQICIDASYRRKGIFRKLYETMKNAIQPDFDFIITEVDAKNNRSLQAHYAVGFTDLKTYRSGGQDWKLIRLAVQ